MSDELKPLRWTSEPPRVPGWYWMKTSIDSGHHHMIEYPWPRPNPPEYRYAGPIPEPVDDDEPDAPTLRDEAVAVLADMDERAGEMGDQGAFQPWRERLRAALKGGGA